MATRENGMRFGQREQGGNDKGGGEEGAKARIRELRAEGSEGGEGREGGARASRLQRSATCRGLRATCTYCNFACVSAWARPLTFARMGQRDRRSCARVNGHKRELAGIG